MKTFTHFISEQKEKSATFTFGRFNPPTTGHEKLVKKLASVGRGTDVLLFSSHSNDKRKNPLTHKDKVKYLKKFFGDLYRDFPKVDHIHFHGFYIGNFPSLEKNKIEKLCKIINSV